MKTICQICKKEFEAIRNDAKCCSSTCRSVAKRNATDNTTDNATDKLSVANKPGNFVNHITGEEHETAKISEKTGLSYDLNERSKILELEKRRCPGCGEPTWYGCAQCGAKGVI